MKVPLLDLKPQYLSMEGELKEAFAKVFDSQHFIGGPQIAELEKIVADYCGCKHAFGVSSGTDAILASLLSLGIGRSPVENEPAPEVIVPTFTFFATAGSVWRAGAKPVFVDIDPVSFNINCGLIEEKITERTKAIIPVHLFGQCADMYEIMEIAKKHNLKVVEDACQSIGTMQNGKKAGAFGDAGCFSFFPSKNLGGFGDGGMVVCNDDSLAEKLRQVRNHGMEPRYYHRWVGGNFRLDSLQAAGLTVKMKYLERWHKARAQHAEFYAQELKDVHEITLPQTMAGNRHIYNQFVILTDRRDALMSYLRENEIGCEIYYPVPLHLQECFKPLGYKAGDMPVAESIAKRCLALPVYPDLTKEQLKYTTDTIKKFFAK